MKALLLAFVLAAAAFAADVNFTGTWTGKATITTPDGDTRESGAVLVLKHEGTAVTGTAGPSEDRQVPISNGKAEGPKLAFAIQAEEVAFTFNLVLKEDHLTGDASGSQAGQTRKVKFDLTRAK